LRNLVFEAAEASVEANPETFQHETSLAAAYTNKRPGYFYRGLLH
jgi:hypothetical protein